MFVEGSYFYLLEYEACSGRLELRSLSEIEPVSDLVPGFLAMYTYDFNLGYEAAEISDITDGPIGRKRIYFRAEEFIPSWDMSGETQVFLDKVKWDEHNNY